MFPNDTRILIVDDLDVIRMLVSEILVQNGFKRLVEATNGKEALDKLQAAHEGGDPFGLIICDWNMPKLTGIQLLEAKNNSPELKNTPFLMVTIESEKSYVLKAVAMGVNDFVVKPFNGTIIMKKLKDIHDRLSSEDPTQNKT